MRQFFWKKIKAWYLKTNNEHQKETVTTVAYVFLFVGAIICMNDILLPSLKNLFHLSYTQSTRIQQSFYPCLSFFPDPICIFYFQFGI